MTTKRMTMPWRRLSTILLWTQRLWTQRPPPPLPKQRRMTPPCWSMRRRPPRPWRAPFGRPPSTVPGLPDGSPASRSPLHSPAAGGAGAAQLHSTSSAAPPGGPSRGAAATHPPTWPLVSVDTPPLLRRTPPFCLCAVALAMVCSARRACSSPHDERAARAVCWRRAALLPLPPCAGCASAFS